MLNEPESAAQTRRSEGDEHGLVSRPSVLRARVSPWLKRSLPFTGYLLLQAICVAGLPTPPYPDTAYYMQLSFTGQYEMLPTVPLLYHLTLTDPLRMAAQVVIAAICWWVLASVASRMVKDRRVRLGLRLVLLALGVVGPIVQWNSVLLSESLEMSLTALLVAAWMAYQQQPRAKTAAAALVVTVFWTFTRQAQLSLVLAITAIALLNAVMHRRDLVRIVVVLVLVLTSVAGLALIGRNRTFSMKVLSDIVEDRILVNSSYTSWFIAHGMPYSSAIQSSAGGSFGTVLQNTPVMASWLVAKGTRTYVLFVLSHPDYTLLGALPYFSGEKPSLLVAPNPVYASIQPDPTPSLLSPDANWARHRSVLPAVIEELLFQQGQFGDVLALASVGGLLLVVARRYRRRDSRLWVPGMLAASVIPQVYLVFLTGGVGELDRLAMPVAVSARIALWLIVGFAADRILSERDAQKPHSAPGTA